MKLPLDRIRPAQRCGAMLRTPLIAAVVCYLAFTGLLISSATAQSPDLSLLPELIKQLKSQEYAQRQLATKEILELGPAVLPELRSTERSSSLEFNQRIEDLMAVLEAVDAGENSLAAKEAWLQFGDAEFETRDLILDKLMALKLYDTYFALLAQLDDNQIRTMFEENNSVYSVIADMCRNERWDEIEHLLSTRLMWKYQPWLCARYHFLMGTLDQQIQIMRQRFDRQPAVESNQLNGDELELKTLIGLLMFKRQYDAASRYIGLIAEEDPRRSAATRLLFNKGDWQELADRAVLADSDYDLDKPFLECSPREYVLLKQYSGGPAAGIKAVEEIERQEAAAGTLDEGMMTMLHMLTFNWDKAKDNLGLKADDLSLRFLSLVNRPLKILELSGAGDTFESREKWMKQQRANSQKGLDKLARWAEKGGSIGKRRQEVINEVTKTLDYYLAVCEQMLELGLEHEAILYLRQAYVQVHDVDDFSDLRERLVATICETGRPEFTLPFLEESGFSDTQIGGMIGTRMIFHTDSSAAHDRTDQAQFLNRALNDVVTDPISRLYRVAVLLNSALAPTDPTILKTLYPDGFDLDAELALVEHNSNRNSCWQMSLLYHFQQRDEEASQWKQMAATKGNEVALFQIAEDAFAREDFEVAAQLFDAHFERSSEYYPLAIAARAYQLAGQSDLANRRMFYASIIPDHYDSPMATFYQRFIFDERGDWICDLARLEICLNENPGRSDFRDVMQCFKTADPVESSNFGRRSILDLEVFNALQMYFYLAIFNTESRTQDLMAAIERRDFEMARAIFDQIISFSPGSPSLVEKSVPRLDELGQTELADYMTSKAGEYFVRTLKEYPNSANHRNNYAWVLACAQRQLDTVLRHAQAAVALRPDQATYIDTLAEAHFARGEYDLAAKWIKKAVALDPPRLYYRNQLKKFQQARSKDGLGQ